MSDGIPPSLRLCLFLGFLTKLLLLLCLFLRLRKILTHLLLMLIAILLRKLQLMILGQFFRYLDHHPGQFLLGRAVVAFACIVLQRPDRCSQHLFHGFGIRALLAESHGLRALLQAGTNQIVIFIAQGATVEQLIQQILVGLAGNHILLQNAKERTC